jgi:uncharacterized protein
VIEVAERDGGVIFAVRVVPRASRDAMEGEHAGALKIRLTAPPAEDRANQALRRLLSERLNVPIAAVRIIAGAKSRTKRVSVAGASAGQVLAFCVPQPKGWSLLCNENEFAGRRKEMTS